MYLNSEKNLNSTKIYLDKVAAEIKIINMYVGRCERSCNYPMQLSMVFSTVTL